MSGGRSSMNAIFTSAVQSGSAPLGAKRGRPATSDVIRRKRSETRTARLGRSRTRAEAEISPLLAPRLAPPEALEKGTVAHFECSRASGAKQGQSLAICQSFSTWRAGENPPLATGPRQETHRQIGPQASAVPANSTGDSGRRCRPASPARSAGRLDQHPQRRGRAGGRNSGHAAACSNSASRAPRARPLTAGGTWRPFRPPACPRAG